MIFAEEIIFNVTPLEWWMAQNNIFDKEVPKIYPILRRKIAGKFLLLLNYFNENDAADFSEIIFKFDPVFKTKTEIKTLY